MKRIVLLVLAAVFAGCHRAPAGPVAGAPSARGAVEAFLAAARARDVRAFGAVWGTERGAARDRMDRRELEQRSLVLACLLTHDQSRIGQQAVAAGARQVFPVELRSGTRTASTRVTAVLGPSDRWFVETVEVEPLRDLCRQPGTPNM